MKICCIADIHIGMKTYGKIDPVTHFNIRELDGLQIFKNTIQYCIDNDIVTIVIAGDVYHQAVSSPMLQEKVNEILKYAIDNGRRLFILIGNHDLKPLATACSALKPLDTFNIPNVIQSDIFKEVNYTLDNESVRFVFLPTYHTAEEIHDILTNKITHDNTPIICIGHMSVQGAALNDWLISTNENFVDINDFKQDDIKAVILGHLHKHQVLMKKPITFYTGSLQRLDFNEEKQPKGFVILDTANWSYEFIPVDAQDFYTIDAQVDQVHSFDDIYKKIDTSRIKNAIVRVRIRTTSEFKLTNSQEKELSKYIEKFKPSNLLSIQQKLEDVRQMRNSALNESISIEKGLEIYFDGQKRSKERIAIGKKLLKEVKNE